VETLADEAAPSGVEDLPTAAFEVVVADSGMVSI